MPAIPALLTIVFVVLKLTHVIHWSWWWIMSPMLAQLALFLIVVAISVGVMNEVKNKLSDKR